MSELIINEVVDQMREMPDNLQQEVLLYTRQINKTAVKGISGKNLLQFVGTIPKADLELMQRVIEAECEQVDLDEW